MPRSQSPGTDWRPQLATLTDEVPADDGWLHELKFDGYRIACALGGKTVRLITRNGNDWTKTFPELVGAARRLKVRSALLDGEVAILLPDGRTSFQDLQNAIARPPPRKSLVYFVFDLLELDGEDLRTLPVERRKETLSKLLAALPGHGVIRYSSHVVGNGRAVFEQACALRAEGIVSKRLGSTYRAGRGGSWLKTKCVLRQEFVIGGFTDPEGTREAIGALLVGYHADSGGLVFAGKVGTGFTTSTARALRQRLNALETSTCPFEPRPEGWLGRHAHWVRPELLCEVVFSEWTRDGKIRHPSFQGLREDKHQREVVRERPKRAVARADAAKAKLARRTPQQDVRVAGVRLSHPDRVLFPADGITKAELARYFESVSEWALPHYAGRPLTLFRCPERIGPDCYFMKHSKVWAPEALRRERIQEKTKVGEYLIADTAQALVSLVQMDIVEVHTWNSRFRDVERPDRIVIDLDPGPEVEWGAVVDAARLVRGMLEAIGLESFLKTTGGVGLHVVVPLLPRADWTECLAFAKAFAGALARHDPKRFTTTFTKAGRERKILLDYLRNNRTNTSVAAFSPRARPGAPVSTPLSWDELSPKRRSDAFTLRTLPKRLARLKKDPWARYFSTRQRLAKDAAMALSRL